ncbi:hypothetical protein D3C77_463210 [compost metagenome]
MATSKPLITEDTTSCRVNPWKIIALAIAKKDENSITGIVGFFVIDPYKTMSTGTRSSKFQSKIVSRVDIIVPTFSGTTAPAAFVLSPVMIYTIPATTNDGSVVYSK